MFMKTVGHLQRRLNKLFSIMAQQKDQFRGQVDRYNGIIINSKDEPCEVSNFADRLEASLNQWIKDKRRTIWFKVDLSQTHWIPELTKRGFKFHHAKEKQVTLYRWLPTDDICNIPPYAHTNLGVGAVVLNEETNEILVIKENHGVSTTHWKLPGGYVEPGENINIAVEREVLEETGVTAKFKCIIAFRHVHQYAFDCSDIYIVSFLTPQTYDITKCNREVSECKWMKLQDFMSHPNVHENNRLLANKVVEYLDHRMGIVITEAIHPINKKPLCIFNISDTHNS